MVTLNDNESIQLWDKFPGLMKRISALLGIHNLKKLNTTVFEDNIEESSEIGEIFDSYKKIIAIVKEDDFDKIIENLLRILSNSLNNNNSNSGAVLICTKCHPIKQYGDKHIEKVHNEATEQDCDCLKSCPIWDMLIFEAIRMYLSGNQNSQISIFN